MLLLVLFLYYENNISFYSYFPKMKWKVWKYFILMEVRSRWFLISTKISRKKQLRHCFGLNRTRIVQQRGRCWWFISSTNRYEGTSSEHPSKRSQGFWWFMEKLNICDKICAVAYQHVILLLLSIVFCVFLSKFFFCSHASQSIKWCLRSFLNNRFD